MTESTFPCPNCKFEIKLTESLAAPLVESTRRDFEGRLAAQSAQFATKEKAIRDRESALQTAAETLDQRLADAMRLERSKIAAEESKKAKQALALEFDQKSAETVALQQALNQNNLKLAEAQKAQALLITKQRELDDAKREMDLTIQKQVQSALSAVRDKARLDAEESLHLKIAEKDQTLAAMQKQIEELKRKSEQGSQQLQGEVLELQLESLLREKFPLDLISPVPKGDHGGDILHHILSPHGTTAGIILWESKRTKNWSDSWLPKLRDDQRAAKADLAIIISQTLPKGLTTFDQIDGVWIAAPNCMLSLALALRLSLLELAHARSANAGQETKQELMYNYLTGPRFRQRVQAIVEAFSTMLNDLNTERKVISKQWAKREEQINRVMLGTTGMIGDLQAIAGKSLHEIEGLSLNLLDTPQ